MKKLMVDESQAAPLRSGWRKIGTGVEDSIVSYQPNTNPRFRSSSGVIRSANPQASKPRLTATDARNLLNELYFELAKHDLEAAERICKNHNA